MRGFFVYSTKIISKLGAGLVYFLVYFTFKPCFIQKCMYFYIIKQTNNMKITIELTEAEVKGIKAYTKETEGTTANRAAIVEYIQGIVSGTIHAPQESVSDYIARYENQ